MNYTQNKNEAFIKLESKIDYLIEKVEEDSEYLFEDEFELKYTELKEYLLEVEEREIDSLSDLIDYDNEKEYKAYKRTLNEFKKIKNKFTQFVEENDLEDGADSDWMFDNED